MDASTSDIQKRNTRCRFEHGPINARHRAFPRFHPQQSHTRTQARCSKLLLDADRNLPPHPILGPSNTLRSMRRGWYLAGYSTKHDSDILRSLVSRQNETTYPCFEVRAMGKAIPTGIRHDRGMALGYDERTGVSVPNTTRD